MTIDDAAVIVGLIEGMQGSVPAVESWQAVMQQLYIDTRSDGGRGPFTSVRMIALHRPSSSGGAPTRP
ncbi:MAG: hypothetical protein ACXVYI_00320 [Mycobacterium sp.]